MTYPHNIDWYYIPHARERYIYIYNYSRNNTTAPAYSNRNNIGRDRAQLYHVDIGVQGLLLRGDALAPTGFKAPLGMTKRKRHSPLTKKASTKPRAANRNNAYT